LRDLTRHRTQLVEEKTRTSNRIEKVLEDANIKLGSVASEVLGVSGRSMGRDFHPLAAEHARRTRKKPGWRTTRAGFRVGNRKILI